MSFWNRFIKSFNSGEGKSGAPEETAPAASRYRFADGLHKWSFTTLIAAAMSVTVGAAEELAYSIKLAGRLTGVTDGKPRTVIINECDISEKSKRCIAEPDSAGRLRLSCRFITDTHSQ